MSVRKVPRIGWVKLVLTSLLCVGSQTSIGARLPQDATELNDASWTLELLNGQPLIAGSTITLHLRHESLDGNGGCNGYASEYEVTPTNFGVTGVIINESRCNTPAGIMQQEDAYVQALEQVAVYRLINNRLELGNNAGDAILVFRRQKDSSC